MKDKKLKLVCVQFDHPVPSAAISESKSSTRQCRHWFITIFPLMNHLLMPSWQARAKQAHPVFFENKSVQGHKQ
jgi:hypothetical protein